MMIRILPWSIGVAPRSNNHQTENRDASYRWMQQGIYPITKPLYMFPAWHQVVTPVKKTDALRQVISPARQLTLAAACMALLAVWYDIDAGYFYAGTQIAEFNKLLKLAGK